jgi:hypothetical protein
MGMGLGREDLLTEALTDVPLGIQTEKLFDSLLAGWCGTGKEEPDAAQIILAAFLLAAQHPNQDRGNLNPG